MKLTKFDVTRLKSFQRARECAPTAGNVLWHVKWLLALIMALVFAAFCISPSTALGYGVLGFGIGSVFCTCASAVILARFWPLTREVLNWDRIEQLLKEHEGSVGRN